MQKIFKILPLALVAVVILQLGSALPASAAADLIIERDFETGDLWGFFWEGKSGVQKPEVVSSPGHPVRAGNYSMRSHFYVYDTEREEVLPNNNRPENDRNEFRFNINEEYWIGFSVYIPSDFVFDVPNWTDIIFQVQGIPEPGEWYGQPLLSIAINHDEWNIMSRWDSRWIMPVRNDWEGSDKILGHGEAPLGSDVGKWTDWIIHVKWDFEESGDGFLEIWRDGNQVPLCLERDSSTKECITQVLRRERPNCRNDASGPHLAMGCYKWPWYPDTRDTYGRQTDWRTIYHDEFRIGGADASYADVAPGGGPLPTPTPTLAPTSTPIPTSTPPPIPGDLDGDRDVDIFDLIIVGSHFGENVGVPCTLDPCPDTDGDGDVDIFDLITVGSHFGETGWYELVSKLNRY
jgi:hypothetical protein